MTANTLTKHDLAPAHLPAKVLTGVNHDLPLPTVRAVFDPYEFHRLRYADERASITHRDESGQWLLDNGFIGLNGRMIVLRGGQ